MSQEITHLYSYCRGFGKDIAKKHELQVDAEKLSLEGPYEIKGKVLILPISGSGKSNLTIGMLTSKYNHSQHKITCSSSSGQKI